jgi:trigger factor
MLEARYGVEVLYDDAIDALLPEAYDFILNETKLEPIDRPEVDVVTFEKGQRRTVKFVVTVPPPSP